MIASMLAPIRLSGSRALRTSLTLLSTVACIATAQAAPTSIQMEVGQQRTWTQPRPIQRAATADDDIVGINVAPPSGVILTAKKPGSAMVSVWETGGQGKPSAQFQVVVSPGGVGTLERGVQLSSAGPKLRLTGQLSSLERHGAIVSAVREAPDKPVGNLVDGSSAKFDTQVQIDVKIVEVSRSKLMASGFYFDRFFNNRNARVGLSGPSNLSGFESTSSAGRTLNSTSGFLPSSDTFNIFTWGRDTLAVFSALEANGFAYTLAEPSLSALSGQTATFLAGGEIPIPIRNGSGADSSVTIFFKEFGIRLGLSPTVLDDERITVKVSPEVSEIDPALSVQISGFNIPGLRVRRTDTTVSTANGETFVLSGLVSRTSSADIDKFPVLGDIPILGAFFKSSRIEREDKELLMIVTPRLVRPLAKEAKLPVLPGEELRQYEPGFLRTLLFNRGRFPEPDTGFSQ